MQKIFTLLNLENSEEQREGSQKANLKSLPLGETESSEEDLKRCFKCQKTKPRSEFYKHRYMGDGLLGKCKECTKLDVSRRYHDPESRIRISEYEKARFQSKKRKEKVSQYQADRRRRNPEKYKARNAVSNAIRDGRLERKPCVHCGSQNSQAHHEDYSKPLDVIWCCFKCHREIEHGQTTTETIVTNNPNLKPC